MPEKPVHGIPLKLKLNPPNVGRFHQRRSQRPFLFAAKRTLESQHPQD
jgi:hypothetical protein